LVKKYLLGKAKYLQKLARKAKCPWASAAHDDQSTAVLPGTVDVSSDESEVPESPPCIDTSQVLESPVRITPIKPMKHLVLSPNTCTKIADNKAAALARRAALETAAPGLKCALCAEDITVQNSKDNLCTSCLQVLDVSKEQSEGDKGNNCEVTVKKEKRIKKAQAALKIDFKGANKIEEDGSKKKSRIKKKTKVHDM
jgi:hypothetical protein